MPVLETVAGEFGEIIVHRFGTRGARPKIYLQAGLHADEVAGTVVLYELMKIITVAEQMGRIKGELILVPHCNPRGLKQFVLGRHLGRFDLSDGRNFNRGFPDISALIVDVITKLSIAEITSDSIVKIGDQIFSEFKANSPGDNFRNELMKLSWGADIVIDIHSDMEATLHIYSSAKCWEKIKVLSDHLDIRTAILCDISSDHPFDEAHSNCWRAIEDHLLGRGLAIASRTASCTLELRGLADVEPLVSSQDAACIANFLVDAGAFGGPIHSAVSQAPTIPIPLDAVEMITSPITGILVHLKAPGETVQAGDVVAKIFDPSQINPEITAISLSASQAGLIFARWHQRVIQAGMAVCKIAGKDAMPHSPRAALLD